LSESFPSILFSKSQPQLLEGWPKIRHARRLGQILDDLCSEPGGFLEKRGYLGQCVCKPTKGYGLRKPRRLQFSKVLLLTSLPLSKLETGTGRVTGYRVPRYRQRCRPFAEALPSPFLLAYKPTRVSSGIRHAYSPGLLPDSFTTAFPRRPVSIDITSYDIRSIQTPRPRGAHLRKSTSGFRLHTYRP